MIEGRKCALPVLLTERIDTQASIIQAFEKKTWQYPDLKRYISVIEVVHRKIKNAVC